VAVCVSAQLIHWTAAHFAENVAILTNAQVEKYATMGFVNVHMVQWIVTELAKNAVQMPTVQA